MATLEWALGNRNRSSVGDLRYASDLTNEEWALVEQVIPPAKRGGNKRTVDIRRVVDGLMYVLSHGCQWTAIPKDLPPRTTLNEYFRRWNYDGTLVRIHQTLCGVQPRSAEWLVAAAVGPTAGTSGTRRVPEWTPLQISPTNPASGNSASW
jgi:transposase